MRRPLPLLACLALSCLAVGCGGDSADTGATTPATPATSGPTAGLDPDAKVIAHSKPTVTFDVVEPEGDAADLDGTLGQAKAAADDLGGRLPGEELQGMAQDQVDALTTQARQLADTAQAQWEQQQAQLAQQADAALGAQGDDLSGSLGGLLGGGSAGETADVAMSTAEDGSVVVEGITIPTAAQAQAAAEAEVDDGNADALLAELLADIDAELVEDG